MLVKPTLYPKFMLLAIGVVVCFIVYFINVGFDINDEGFYFLGYDKEQNIFFSTTGFHFIVRLFPDSDNIVMNRIYRLLLHFIGAFFLFLATFNYFKPKGNFLVGLCWVLIGSLASYVYAPNSLSYNTINLFLLELSLSVFLILLLTKIESKNYKWWAVLLMILISLLIFNKASSGVLVLGVFALYYLLFDSSIFIKKLRKISIFGVVVVAMSAFWFWITFGHDIFIFYHEAGNAKLNLASDHNGLVYHLKQLFVNPFFQSKKQLVFVFGFLFIFFLERKYKLRWSVASNLAEAFYLLISLLLFAYYLKYYACGPGAEIFTAILVFLTVAVFIINMEWLVQNAGILILIFCLPLIGFAGSNVSPFEGMNHYLAFYFTLIFLIGKQVEFFFLKVFYFLSGVFIVIRFVVFPFENPPLYSLTKDVKFNDFSEVVIVKDEVKAELLSFKEFVESAELSKDVAFLNVSPGILYLDNKINYGTLYYNSPGGLNYYLNYLLNRDSSSTIDYVIRSVDGDSLKSAIVMAFMDEKRKSGLVPDTLIGNSSYVKIRFRRIFER